MENPIAAANNWKNQGAKWIHVIDLDGAKSGIPGNTAVIKKIREAVNVNIQIGGGIRDANTA